MNAGLLLLHGFLGAALVAHALQKLLVFRFAGTTAYVRGLGLRAPSLLAAAVIANELVGGALVGLGMLLPLGTALIASTMLVAARTDHRGKGLWIWNYGAEHVLTNAVVVVALAVAAPARWSLDNAIGWDVHGIAWGAGAAVVALVGGGTVLALFRRSDAAITPNPAAIAA